MSPLSSFRARLPRRTVASGRTPRWLTWGLALLALTPAVAAQETLPLPALLGRTHVHGLAMEPTNTSQLWIATHHGFYLAGADGTARLVSDHRDDLMGFTPHPGVSGKFYASGHPAGGGNLGIIVSEDGGRTWRPLSPGFGGPVDFHQMDISHADPRVLYGVYGTLQVSRDAGRTWRAVGPRLERTIDLAASALDADAVYLATAKGLLRSRDGGASWQSAHPAQETATLVATLPDGTVYAFLVGVGLLRAREPALEWELVSNDFGKRALTHLATDPADPRRMVVATHLNELLTSRDGGRKWEVLALPTKPN